MDTGLLVHGALLGTAGKSMVLVTGFQHAQREKFLSVGRAALSPWIRIRRIHGAKSMDLKK